MKSLCFATLVLALNFCSTSFAKETLIAVATNFLPTAKSLVEEFELESEADVTLVSGSTGQLFAQITQGAPFHAFFSADQERVNELVKRNLADSGSQFTYAVGRICFFVTPKKESKATPREIFNETAFEQVAIANPRSAPYGKAALEALDSIGLTQEKRESKLITAGNVSQAFSMVSTGNAEVGIVALSSILDGEVKKEHYYLIPPSKHSPIKQDAVLLKAGANNEAAVDFLEFVASNAGKAIIRGEGYKLD